jgi:glycerol-3-phosphate dehydrogenase
MTKHVDVFIIGGGINGVGIARDAAGRGYSVALCEKEDLASGTSNWSSKLVHGGVRYLEHYEFGLVRKALKEREVLWAAAPHIVRPMRFILPHHKDLRPAWLLRLGLFLYDHIGGRKLLPATKTVDLKNGPFGKPLKAMFTKGFQYSDAQVDDARLVVLNAMDAQTQGAEIATHREVTSARREGEHWHIDTRNEDGTEVDYTASVIVNAAGPWVDIVLGETFGANDASNIRLVKGSHIVVPALFEHDNAYIFQNADERIIFAIPWREGTTLIGTTDEDFEGNPRDAKISQAETDYLCAAASEYFEKPITPDTIVWTYAGVRPLYDDGASAAQEATRDYIFRRDGQTGEVPLLNIFGGKITTYRELSEKMLASIEDELGRRGRPWTSRAPLPGGDFPVQGFDQLVAQTQRRYPFLTDELTVRLCRNYGTRVTQVLGNAEAEKQLGKHFGAGLYEVEVRYLMTNEWAQTATDVVERRTKLLLRMTKRQINALEKWMAAESG